MEEELIRGCLKHEPAAQRELYLQYFDESMCTCVRYSKNQQEAKDILLDGFKNILNRFRNYAEMNAKRKGDTPPVPLGEWIKKEIIASAIQHMHDNKKQHFVSSTVSMRDSEKPSNQEVSDEQIIKGTDRQTIINALRQLTPSYRAIYNLHEIEGYSHAEISKLLDVSEYISRDSFAKAKINLRKNIVKLLPTK